MTIEQKVTELTQATTDLLGAVNVRKSVLDDAAAASLNSANASAASASTATAQANAANTAKVASETARNAAIAAQNNAVAVVTGGTASLIAEPGKIPLADSQGKIDKGFLTDTALVEQTDLGSSPSEAPLNQSLGEMAYMDPRALIVKPQASATPNGLGDMVFVLASDTELIIKIKGSDGAVRSTTLTLA